MKHIHFDHKIDWLMLALILLAFGLYSISYTWLGLEKEQAKFFFTLGGILNVIALTKIFWYKYYVRWNSKAITIKFNSFSGHIIPFVKIENFEFSDSDLIIHRRKNKKKIVIPISEIAKEDLERLKSILISHTQTLKT